MNTIQEGFKTYCQGCGFKTGCNEEEKKKCYVKYIETQIGDLKKELESKTNKSIDTGLKI